MPRSSRTTLNEPVEQDLPDDDTEQTSTFRRRLKGTRQPSGKVHHWAQVWYGSPKDGNPNWYDWSPTEEDIEVAIQEYGMSGWFEDLESNMIKAARELIDEADEEIIAVRLRVRLFSHQSDGDDARFTVEHIRKR